MSREIEQAAEDLTEAARAEGRLSPFRRTLPTEYNDATMQTANARARLLALLAPEPEPSDAEIEAGAKALCRLAWGDAERTMSAESWAVYRDRAKTVLLAARAARQTGGVDIRLNEEQSREFLATAEDEPPGWLKRAAARQARAQGEGETANG